MSSFLVNRKAVRAPKTVRFYKTQLTGLMNWAVGQGIALPRFLDRHMDAYLVQRIEAGIKETTRHHDELCAKVFFKWCRVNHFLKRDPLKDRKLRNPARPFKYTPTPEEAATLIKQLPYYYDMDHNPGMKYHPAERRAKHRNRNLAVILLLRYTAARVGEILSLKVEDYQESERRINITASKGRKPRTIPVNDKTARALADWLKDRRAIMKDVPADEDPGWLFLSELMDKIDEGKFNKILHRITQFAGLPRAISLHSLRRLRLSELSVVDLAGAQEVAGHSDPKTTMIYIEITAERMRKLMEKADELADVSAGIPSVSKKRSRGFISAR
jgi:site-specific recombinase XerD